MSCECCGAPINKGVYCDYCGSKYPINIEKKIREFLYKQCILTELYCEQYKNGKPFGKVLIFKEKDIEKLFDLIQGRR